MKPLSVAVTIALACGILVFAAEPKPKPTDSEALDTVLKKMDSAAANFRSAQAEFEWDAYEKVIDEVDDIQKGTIYYRRADKNIEMMANVKMAGSDLKSLKPEPKFVLFSEGKIRMYQPKPDQVTVYDPGKNRSDVETYLVLGFGGSGQDLVKQFDVTYSGQEPIDGKATAKLQLVPKSQGVRNIYNQMFLWIDMDNGISVQQKFVTPQGDYRLTKYSNIRLNEKLSDDVFRLKTTSKTQTISPRG